MLMLSDSKRRLLARTLADFSKYFMTALVVGQTFIWREKGIDLIGLLIGVIGSAIWLSAAVLVEPSREESKRGGI